MFTTSWDDSFIDAYCKYYKCNKPKFYEQVLWNCHWWFFPLTFFFRMIAVIRPSFVRSEKNALLSIANTNSDREFHSELCSLNYLFHRDANLIKRIFNIRLSEKKLKKLKQIIVYH
jgi:hypothetical protein